MSKDDATYKEHIERITPEQEIANRVRMLDILLKKAGTLSDEDKQMLRELKQSYVDGPTKSGS